jgi:hypothetical protein
LDAKFIYPRQGDVYKYIGHPYCPANIYLQVFPSDHHLPSPEALQNIFSVNTMSGFQDQPMCDVRSIYTQRGMPYGHYKVTRPTLANLTTQSNALGLENVTSSGYTPSRGVLQNYHAPMTQQELNLLCLLLRLLNTRLLPTPNQSRAGSAKQMSSDSKTDIVMSPPTATIDPRWLGKNDTVKNQDNMVKNHLLEPEATVSSVKIMLAPASVSNIIRDAIGPIGPSAKILPDQEALQHVKAIIATLQAS